MPDVSPDRTMDPKDEEIAQLYMSWMITTHSADILEDLQQLTDTALTGQIDFSRIASILATIDTLNLTVPGKPHQLLAPLFAPLVKRYSQLLDQTRKVAAEEVLYARRYISVVLPVLKDAAYSDDAKKDIVKNFISFLTNVQRESDVLQADFDTLRRQLDDFAKLLDAFALEVGAELDIKIHEVQAEIDQIVRDLEEMQRKTQDDQPSLENSSKELLTFGALSTAMADSVVSQAALATAAAKTLVGTASAVGSAGCVGALGAALPVAMVVLAGWGIWAAIKSAEVLGDLARITALSAELVAHQLRLAELLRQTATLGAVQALAHTAISSVVSASTKVGNLVKVWKIVSDDANAMLDLLQSGATTEQIINNALLAESWYNLLVSLLDTVSSKLLPRVEPPKSAVLPSLQHLLEHFACQGGTSHFLPQCRPMPPLSSTIPAHELTMSDFVHDFDDFFDNSMTIDNENLTADQRALAETLTGMGRAQPFLFDTTSGAALGDVGVATLTFGRIGSSVRQLVKAGVVRQGMQQARSLSAFYGPHLTRLTGPAEVQRDLFKEILQGALKVPSLPPNPDHPPPATQQNIVWLLMWRHHLFEWIVREGLWAPWRIWFHPLWSNPILFEHTLDLFAQLADAMHQAFEKWYAERHPNEQQDGDQTDASNGPPSTNMFVAAVPSAVVSDTGATIPANSDVLDDALATKLAEAAEPLVINSSVVDSWQKPFTRELAKWPTQKFARVISTWLIGGDEAYFWQQFGRDVYEDQLELIDQIFRLNLLQLSVLTADFKLSLDGKLFDKLVKGMGDVYQQALGQGQNQRVASAAMYFYAARCPSYGRLVLALALQTVLANVYKSTPI